MICYSSVNLPLFTPFFSVQLPQNLLLLLSVSQISHAFNQEPKGESPSGSIWQKGQGILTLPVEGKEVLLSESSKKGYTESQSASTKEEIGVGLLGLLLVLESSSGGSLVTSLHTFRMSLTLLS